MKLSFLTLGFVGLTISASAASFVTVQCAPPLGAPVTTLNTATGTSCSGGARTPVGTGLASASGEVAISFASNASQFSTLVTSLSSDVRQAAPTTSNPLGPGGSAQASINYQTSITTNGPVRSGFLQLDYTYTNASFYDGYAQSTIGIQVPNTSLITNVTCDSAPLANCSPGLTYYSRTGLIPVTLGSAYTLSATGALNNRASDIDGISSGNLNLTYRFRFFEADQATGVQVFQASDPIATPEPSTWALLIVAAGLFGAGASRRLLNRSSAQ